jgi:hypothetical protein
MSTPSWLPSLLSAGTAALVALSPQIQAGLAQHPTAAAALAALYAILTHLLPSPLQGDRRQ